MNRELKDILYKKRNNKYVDTLDALKILECSSCRTLYKYRQRGLPFKRVGNEILYKVSDLLAWKKPKVGRPRKEKINVTRPQAIRSKNNIGLYR